LGNEREVQPCFGVEFSLLDYLALVEELGRVIRPNKRGYIRASSHTLLERLDINSEEWLRFSESFGSKFRCAVGSVKALESYALHTKRSWVSGKSLMQDAS
jgi:hypothetical protein